MDLQVVVTVFKVLVIKVIFASMWCADKCANRARPTPAQMLHDVLSSVSALTFHTVRPIKKAIFSDAIKPLRVYIPISLPAMALREPPRCLG